MKSSEKLYDLIFVELFMEYSCYLPIAEKLQVPVIGTITISGWQIADHAVGAPNNPAAVQVMFGTYSTEMNLFERHALLLYEVGWSNRTIL